MITIVTGGQTGADRAALDCAMELGVRVNGWVPNGRWAEDGVISAHYVGLRETASADPAERTALNVRDSHGTAIFSHGELKGGSALTAQLAETYARPWIHIDFDAVIASEAVRALTQWTTRHAVVRLNVAGSRESEDPKIYSATREVLLALLSTY